METCAVNEDGTCATHGHECADILDFLTLY